MKQPYHAGLMSHVNWILFQVQGAAGNIVPRQLHGDLKETEWKEVHPERRILIQQLLVEIDIARAQLNKIAALCRQIGFIGKRPRKRPLGSAKPG